MPPPQCARWCPARPNMSPRRTSSLGSVSSSPLSPLLAYIITPFLLPSFVRVELMCEDGRIPRVQGQTEATLTAVVELSPTTRRQPWARPPIDVDFQVLMFTASGLLVRFLKVYERSGYQSVKWVRYLTRAQGTYQIRVSTSRRILSWRTDVLVSVLNIWDFSSRVFRPLGFYNLADYAGLCKTERATPLRRASRAARRLRLELHQSPTKDVF